MKMTKKNINVQVFLNWEVKNPLEIVEALKEHFEEIYYDKDSEVIYCSKLKTRESIFLEYIHKEKEIQSINRIEVQE